VRPLKAVYDSTAVTAQTSFSKHVFELIVQ
jgi:hypothetical protein